MNPGCGAGRRNRVVAIARAIGMPGALPVCAACVTDFADRRDNGEDGIQITWLLG